MGAHRRTIWSLCPGDSHTNGVISEALLGLHSQEQFSSRECVDGERRDLVDVPDYAFVARFWRSKKDLNLKFEIYWRQGNGKPDLWNFPERKKLTLDALKDKGEVRYAAPQSDDLPF